MRKITVLSMVTLDGVIQGPGGPEEDTENGFKFGGWTAPLGDEAGDKVVMQELSQETDFLLGRKTFEIWENYWPDHGEFWPRINAGTKYVLSTTREQSDWEHSVFIRGVEDIRKLKQTDGPDIQVWGSSQLIQLLLQHELVDVFRLKIYPLLLGEGKKLFRHGIAPSAFTLTEQVVTSTGVIIAEYHRAGVVKTGSFT